MVLYICNKCNKNFNKKQCYDVHTSRKFPCKYEDITNQKLDDTNISNKIKELEENNKQYDESNKELTNKNKQLEDRINELECDNKILNNLLDKFIKNNNIINKNTKDNNDDIKIKMVEGYIYIIRECDFVRLNENIYKIGRTAKANPEDRFQKYRSKANYENEVFIISRY
jgi:predicted nuclease with TOPRIM domain